LLDDGLVFVAARCRPNTVLATAFDLKVRFTVVDKAPAEVTSTDVVNGSVRGATTTDGALAGQLQH
jgi:hypothetical protein